MDSEVEITHILHSSCHVFTLHATYRVVLHVNFFCSIARADLMHTLHIALPHAPYSSQHDTSTLAANSNCVNFVHPCITLR